MHNAYMQLIYFIQANRAFNKINTMMLYACVETSFEELNQ